MNQTKQPIVYITDLHADKKALVDSLHCAGSINQSGALTTFGKNALHVFGGDFLDKGPSNLALLDQLQALQGQGLQTELLIGNHDCRLWVGLKSLDQNNPLTDHFFVRMFPKVMPLFKEVYQRYANEIEQMPLPCPNTLKQLLPANNWAEDFEKLTKGRMNTYETQREIDKTQIKIDALHHTCHESGFDFDQIYNIALKCQALFIQPEGKYHWLFSQSNLMYQHEQYLMVHAGVDDQMCQLLNEQSVQNINHQYHDKKENNLFDLYFGTFGNAIRTKYQDNNLALTHQGKADLDQTNIKVIMQGHQSHTNGQALVHYADIPHLQCDVTLNTHSRQQQGLCGSGYGATIIYPDLSIMTHSKDAPNPKVLSLNKSGHHSLLPLELNANELLKHKLNQGKTHHPQINSSY